MDQLFNRNLLKALYSKMFTQTAAAALCGTDPPFYPKPELESILLPNPTVLISKYNIHWMPVNVCLLERNQI